MAFLKFLDSGSGRVLQYSLPIAAVFIVGYVSFELGGAITRATFSKEIRDFISQGPRNTLWDGYRLCLRVQELEEVLDRPIDVLCDALYDDRRPASSDRKLDSQ